MQNDVLKVFLVYGLKAADELANRMISVCSDENGEKMKNLKANLLEIVHEATGELINNQQTESKSGKSTQSIPIE